MKQKWSYTIALTAVVLVAVSCNDKKLLDYSPEAQAYSSARMAGAAVLAVSYEVEEFSFSEIQSLEKKAVKAIEDIGAMPRLSRQAIEMSIYPDGSFEMISQVLEPKHKDLVPAHLQARPNDWAVQKTVVKNGIARFYDRSGKEIGQQSMPTDFATKLLTEAKQRKANNKNTNIADRITGKPKVDKDEVLAEAKKRGAEIKENNGVTKVKFDLTEDERGGKDTSPKASVQYYDFKNNRLLGGEIYDKQANKILHKSYIKYKTNSNGSSEVEAARSEAYEDDPKTGRKIKHIKQQFYEKMTITDNI
jgi:hypothetical protein